MSITTPSAPDIAEMRAGIEAAVAEGNAPWALHLAEQLWATSPSLAVAGFIKATLRPLTVNFPPKRLDVFRSFTAETLAPLLEAEGLLARCALTVQLGQYNAFIQDLMAALPGADAALVALHTRTAGPALWSGAPLDEMQKAGAWLCENLRTGLDVYRNGVDTPVVLQLLDYPTQDDDRRRVIDDTNAQLTEIANALPDCHAFSIADLAAQRGARWYDERNWAVAKMPYRNDFAPDLARRWFREIRPALGAPLKVMVVDLDNTLWGGVLGEDGSENLNMAPESGFSRLQQTLLDLKKRGVLLALASKNDEPAALAVLSGHAHCLLRPDDFAAHRINWRPKSENIQNMANELGLGVDSFAFLDDNPVERAEVARALPALRILPHFTDSHATADLIASHPDLWRVKVSAEDVNRTALYQQRKRQQDAASGTSREEFLASLQQQVLIEPLSDEAFARLADLERKTNQFNVRTRRFSESELRRFAAGPGSFVAGFRVLDRFGDNGIVGLVVVSERDKVATIENFLMSCRVISRNVELAMMDEIARRAVEAGCVTLEGGFTPTPKNGPAKDFFKDAGFTLDRMEGVMECWRRNIKVGI